MTSAGPLKIIGERHSNVTLKLDVFNIKLPTALEIYFSTKCRKREVIAIGLRNFDGNNYSITTCHPPLDNTGLLCDRWKGDDSLYLVGGNGTFELTITDLQYVDNGL